MKRLHAVTKCGLTPSKLALTICLGIAVGTMPLLCGTTLICVMLAHLFKLNHLALQSLNYLLYPVQLALIVPFFKLGEWLFPWGASVPRNLLDTMLQHPWSSLSLIGWITLKSLAAWVVTILPAALLSYGIFNRRLHAWSLRSHHPDP